MDEPKKSKLCESQAYLYPVEEPTQRTVSFRKFIIVVALLNFVAISIVTGYILYNVWLLEKTINQPFVDWQKEDTSSSFTTYFSSSVVSKSSVFKAPPANRMNSASDQCSVAAELKFDCNPDEPINQEVCESRGCCWVPVSRRKRMLPLNIPYCFYPNGYNGYKIVDIQQGNNNATIKLTRETASSYPADIQNVDVQIIGLDNERLRIRFVDSDKERFEVPMPYFNLDQQDTISSPLYKIKVNDDGRLQISRASTGTIVFNVDLTSMIYADQYIELINMVPNTYLYGLGEHKATFRKDLNGWARYTMLARDMGPTENVNLYGSYPFYIMPEDDADMNVHGIFLLNSNPMDVLTQATPAVTYRTVGGILDFFIFMGPTGPEVVRQNVNLIGKPVLQPDWAFGFHLCRYGYNSLAKTRETLERNLAAGIPIEAQWNDIDYMENYNDFTIDPNNFAGLGDFVKELHSKDMHYVVMLDPGVSASEPAGTYPPYEDGVAADIFVKDYKGDIFIGKVWNLQSTAFPDFTNPKTTDYWKSQLIKLREKVEFDGIWIDMNEPANFLDGSMTGCPDDPLENPPYNPGGGILRARTVCMTAQQHLGLHYNVHNLYGLYENVVAYNASIDILAERPFILSRSTFPSQGHFASHWSGDIQSSWDHMKYSISNMLEFNLYGIPMVGSDICGFSGTADEELCKRWSALGAFYPFSRNHNDIHGNEQDPAFFGDAVVAAAKYALDARYRLLPYLYTLFAKATSDGDTVARPLWFEYPLDKNTYGIETSFLWGSSLYIVPVLDGYTTQVQAYFPADLWYNFEDQQLAFESSGETKTLTIDDDKIGLFMRGGSIIPVYKNSAPTIKALKKQKYYLNAYLDKDGKAVGEIYHDDGRSVNSLESGKYVHANCNANKERLVCSYLNVAEFDNYHIGGVTIAGLTEKPKSIHLNGQYLADNSFTHDKSILTIDLPDNFYSLQSFSVEFRY